MGFGDDGGRFGDDGGRFGGGRWIGLGYWG